MAWSVKYDTSTGIVIVLYTGHVTSVELREAGSERVRLQKETGATSVLVDTSATEKLFARTMDIYQIPTELYIEKGATRQCRISVVLPTPKKAREGALFFETVARNRGWPVKVFEEHQDAVDWLLDSALYKRQDAHDRLNKSCS